jgi:hypothetical protein
VPWRDLRSGSGFHGRFAGWAADDAFDRLLAAAQSRSEVGWLVALDSTMVRAHQHTVAKGDSRPGGWDVSRGGLTSKMHPPATARAVFELGGPVTAMQ